jgi:hypothetical protein
MRTATAVFSALAMLLLVLLPLVAGCLTIPGPESGQKTPAVTTAMTSSPMTQMTPLITTSVPTVVRTPVPAITTQQAGYEAKTCMQQGGTVVTPGQQCKGTWLAATDTFSCCSVKPVPEGSGNATVTVGPFNLTVNLDDSPGSIGP